MAHKETVAPGRLIIGGGGEGGRANIHNYTNPLDIKISKVY